MAQIQRDVWRTEQLAEASDYAGFGPLLPGLLMEAHLAVAVHEPGGLALLVRCCFAVERLSKGTGHHELAWLAAERAHTAAQLANDPTMVAAADVLRGFALVSLGARPRDRALAIVTRALTS